ncbi:MAG: ATP-dependent helicase RecG [Chloroflexota bacterium]|jgi:ATP-dependent DNA helicase RecG|nr:ATP-dependent helicase RecG [Chloroflexota bacterium]
MAPSTAARNRATTAAASAAIAAGGAPARGRAGAAVASKPAAPVDLDTRLADARLPGTAALKRAGPRLGLQSVRDLLFHLPRRYEDLRELRTVRQLEESEDGAIVTARLQVVSVRVEPTFRRRIQRTLATLRDETGELQATWFGRRFIERRLREGDWIVASGKLKRRGWSVTLDNPEFQPEDTELLHTGRIVPVYRLTQGLSARILRNAIRSALDTVQPYTGRDYLPAEVQGERIAISRAVEGAHYPEDEVHQQQALDRLAFDELLALQIGMVSRQRSRGRDLSEPIPVEPARLAEAVRSVEATIDAIVRSRDPEAPAVALTADQRQAVEAVAADLASDRPMMRLLQGDVGSGKTAVAAIAMALVADAGRQAALLAPTDLLARQHAVTLAGFLEPLGHEVTLLTGSMAAAARRSALELIEAPVGTTTSGTSAGRIVIGTHALVQESVRFADLRLAVVDEQHRFGVAEREALAAKGTAPHVLLMTATPIPRTLGQILHADLDVSDLHAAPVGRKPVRTAIRQRTELLRHGDGPGVIPFIVGQAAAGRRTFVIVPLVEEDETGGATSVEQAAQLLRDGWAEAAGLAGAAETQAHIEIVHGQMKAADRDERMDRFRRGDTTVLVGTTVLEVGVDVPQATVMLILDADRFGVAQLHQLRGRVGRGEDQAYCILVSSLYPRRGARGGETTDEQKLVKARLDALVEHTDGFVLADLDFELRGEGEMLGLQQSGLPPLRVASLSRKDHRDLSREARVHAEALVDEAGRLAPGHAALEAELTRGWLARVGAGDVLAPDEIDG